MSTPVNTAQVLDALGKRTQALLESFADTESKEINDYGEMVLKLGEQVRNLQIERKLRGVRRLVPVHAKSRGELMAALHDLAVAIGGLEASLLRLPPTGPALHAFQRRIAQVASVQLGDERYLEVYGHYDGTDARKSSWQVREVNRQIARRERGRERRWGKIGVYLAFALGVLSIGVAAMAIPTEHSFYCRFADRLDLCK